MSDTYEARGPVPRKVDRACQRLQMRVVEERAASNVKA